MNNQLIQEIYLFLSTFVTIYSVLLLIHFFSFKNFHINSNKCYNIFDVKNAQFLFLYSVILLGIYFVFNKCFWLFTLPILFAIIFFDIKTFHIPNVFIALDIINTIFYFSNTEINLCEIMFSGSIAFSFPFIGYLIYKKIYQKDVIGMGDLKLFFSCGMWINIEYLPFFFILTGCFGLLSFFIYKIVLKRNISRIPFAPSIIIARVVGYI